MLSLAVLGFIEDGATSSGFDIDFVRDGLKT